MNPVGVLIHIYSIASGLASLIFDSPEVIGFADLRFIFKSFGLFNSITLKRVQFESKIGEANIRQLAEEPTENETNEATTLNGLNN